MVLETKNIGGQLCVIVIDEQIEIINPFDLKDKIFIIDSQSEIVEHVKSLIERAESNEILLNSLIISADRQQKIINELRKEIKALKHEIQLLTAQMVTETQLNEMQNRISNNISDSMKQDKTNVILYALFILAFATGLVALFSVIIQ